MASLVLDINKWHESVKQLQERIANSNIEDTTKAGAAYAIECMIDIAMESINHENEK